MPLYKFTVQSGANSWEETYDDDRAVDDASAAKCAAQMLDQFNATERVRYGDRAKLRTLINAQFVGSGPRAHDYDKRNSVTIMDGHGSRDKWVCRRCGCEALRYGLSSVFKRTGKWRAKKYEHCSA